MPTIITRGAGSAQGLGYASSSAAVTYVEDVFSTYLYTGNGSTQTITNGIDLSGKGGLVWCKQRDGSALNLLYDTNRGAGYRISSDLTDAQVYDATTRLTSFTSSGFTLGNLNPNGSGATYASWTFRKQPKFFDVVTYTGTGSNATISHNLGSEPGCIIVKRTDAVASWYVYHRGLSGIGNKYIVLNSTAAEDTGFFWTPTSTTFNVSSTLGVTANGGTNVAYLFAHDAGGFGLTGTDNVISCGSYNRTDGVKSVVNLGYEPQFIIQKTATAGSQWTMLDVMRGWTGASNSNLFANLSNAETTGNIGIMPTATGFEDYTTAGATDTIIYIAIRRGPMKVPTSGTSVFNPAFRNATLPGYTSNFPVDWATRMYRPGGANQKVGTRLLGGTSLQTNTTSAAASDSEMTWDYMSGWGNDAGATSDLVSHMFRRAPGFFDVVCYTGTGANTTQTHNLGVSPELVIVKARSAASTNWLVYPSTTSLGNALYLNTTSGFVGSGPVGALSSTTVRFEYFGNPLYSASTAATTYVAYLFATCPGVSKVGSYTGTGTTQTINCGFTAGARFVMIKRTDSTGDWYVWDSARGIVAGNDPYLLLNSTAAEVTGTDYVDTAASGFEISSTAPAAINANGGSFIFFAVS